jgi:hypothetical protein
VLYSPPNPQGHDAVDGELKSCVHNSPPNPQAMMEYILNLRVVDPFLGTWTICIYAFLYDLLINKVKLCH